MNDEHIWHDDEGVWVDVGTGVHGPFTSELAALSCAVRELVTPVSHALAQRTSDSDAQEWACDLNIALSLLRGDR